ncbi:ATP-dependent protease [Salmonella sp. NCTC 11881]|nr:ATP-dependent protease [Salmonella sp. NCTC 11881]
MAAARGKNESGAESWYTIRAAADNAADISIYDEIGGWGISAHWFAEELVALGSITQINLHIHSPGGSIFDGLAIYNLLKNHPARKVVYVDGVACSMASVIAMVGDPVIMPENAMMMIHRPRGIAGGESSDIRDYADLLDKMESVIIPIYAEKTGKSPDDIAALLASETWMSGAECVREGFADKVIQPVRAMAHLHSKRLEEFEHMPQNVKNMIIAPQGNAGTLTQPEPEPQAIMTTPPVAVTTPSPQPATTAPGTDEITLRARFQEEQRQRISGIQNVFGMFGNRHGELMAQCIADVDCNVDAAKRQTAGGAGPGGDPHQHAGRDAEHTKSDALPYLCGER